MDLNAFSRRKRAKALQETVIRQLGVFRQLLPGDDRVKRAAQEIVTDLLSVVVSDRVAFDLLEKMAGHGTRLFTHSLRVSMLSTILARELKMGDSSFVKICAIGGLFHECAQLGMPAEMTDMHDPGSFEYVKTLANVESQTRMALKSLEHASVGGEELRYLIAQLHEEPSGLGYPNGLTTEVIFKPALVVAAADAYCTLTERIADRAALTPAEAVERMRSEEGKYLSEAVAALAAAVEFTQPVRKSA